MRFSRVDALFASVVLVASIARAQEVTLGDDNGDRILASIDAAGNTQILQTLVTGSGAAAAAAPAAAATTSTTAVQAAGGAAGGGAGVAAPAPTAAANGATVFVGANGLSQTFTPTFQTTATPPTVAAGTIGDYSQIAASYNSRQSVLLGTNYSPPAPTPMTLGASASEIFRPIAGVGILMVGAAAWLL